MVLLKNLLLLTGDGVYAISKDGNILFSMVTPKITSDINGKIGLHGIATMASTEDNLRQYFSLVLNNWGLTPAEDIVARSLYGKPAQLYELIKNFYVLGPWPSKQDDSNFMLDTIGTMGQGGESTDAIAEKMAIAGDVNPNPQGNQAGRLHPQERARSG